MKKNRKKQGEEERRQNIKTMAVKLSVTFIWWDWGIHYQPAKITLKAREEGEDTRVI